MTASQSTAEEDQPPLAIVAGGAALTSAVALAVVGYMVFEGPIVGVAAGLLSGTGTFFLLQYILAGNLAEDRDVGDRSVSGRQTSGGLHGGAAGFALDASGVTVFALGFVVENQPFLAVLGGLGVAIVGYVVLERVLPQSVE